MRYKILVFGIVFFVCIIVLMEANKSVQAKILNITDIVKEFFLDSKQGIYETYTRHFNQAEEISRLTEMTRDYEKLRLEVLSLKSNNLKLNAIINGGGITHSAPDIHSARIISFATLGERDRVWLQTDIDKFRRDGNQALEDRIYGIIKDNVALGVAVIKNDRMEGFLNGNKECNYGVYIGEHKALGIVSGSHNDNIIVNFVPDWETIKEGDRVFTSGLDGIFLEHVPVGVVEKVLDNYGYLSVEVKPYASITGISYVWVVDRETSSIENTDTPQHENDETIQDIPQIEPQL